MTAIAGQFFKTAMALGDEKRIALAVSFYLAQCAMRRGVLLLHRA
jgi:hypothetical protein